MTIGSQLKVWLVVAAATAHTADVVQAAAESKEPKLSIEPGLVEGCKAPPRSYEGVFYLLKESCLHSSGGVQTCSYMGNVSMGTHFVCAMGFAQPSCKEAFKPVSMHCELWREEYGPGLEKLKQESEEPDLVTTPKGETP